jgi:hypothetical protein
MVEEFIGDVLAATHVEDFEMEAMSQCFSEVGNFQFFLVHQSSMIAHESMLSRPNWPLKPSSSHHGKSVDTKVRKRNCFILESVKSLVCKLLSIRNVQEIKLVSKYKNVIAFFVFFIVS